MISSTFLHISFFSFDNFALSSNRIKFANLGPDWMMFTGRKAVFQIAYRFIILRVPSAITLLPFHFFEFLSTISFSSSVDFLSRLITRFRVDHFQLNDTYSMHTYIVFYRHVKCQMNYLNSTLNLLNDDNCQNLRN